MMRRIVALGLVLVALLVSGGPSGNLKAATPRLQPPSIAVNPPDREHGSGGQAGISRPLAADEHVALPPNWGANYKANTDNNACNGGYTNCAQHEPEIAINPLNNLNAVVGFKDWRDGLKHVYLGTTFDGGATWINQQPAGLPTGTKSDPVVVFGADGTAYASMLPYGGAGEGIYVTKSTDGGATWSAAVAAYLGGGASTTDKDWLTIDTNPASPYYNRLYITWSSLSAGHFDAIYSSNGGATWSSPAALNGGPTWVSIPVVLPNGDVLVTMYGNGSFITQVKSTNGGVSWSAETNAAGVSDVFCWISCTRGPNAQNWRISTMQAAAVDHSNGYLYMVWSDARNDASNGWDIYYSRSTNAGAAWSAPTRLNDDPVNHFIDQVLPTIVVAPDGTVHAAWMDKRNDANNVLLNLYYTYSTDHGVTWQPDTRLSTASSDYNIGIPSDSNNAASDYIGISAITDTVWITWMDTRNNQQDIYTIRGAVSSGGTVTPTPTNTPAVPTNTPTNTPVAPTNTPTNTPVGPTNTPTNTPVGPTNTPTLTPTDCPNPFVDISGNTFYFAIHYLYCRGVVNGVDGSHFAPTGTATRAQFAKVVVLGFGIAPYTPAMPTFSDVPSGYYAYAYIEAGYHAGILNGYDPATCTANGATYPCYLPNLAITRGQVTKLVVSAAHYALVTPLGGGQTYSDVPPSNVFYLYVETAHAKNVVNGFPDGTFRPNASIQRDQMCQIVYKGITTP